MKMRRSRWFFLGFGIFMFTRRSEIVPTIGIAIIIAPIFISGFIRTQTTKKGIFLTFLGFILSVKIASIILLPEDGKAAVSEGLFSKEPSPYEETISKTSRKKESRLYAKPVI